MRRLLASLACLIGVLLGPVLEVAAGPLTHGPMAGAVTPAGAKIWGRTDGPATVQLRYLQAPLPGLPAPSAKLSASIVTSAAADYTFEIPLTGLLANTTYTYTVNVNGHPEQSGTMITALPYGASDELRIAFVSDAFHYGASTVWTALAAQHPHGFSRIGDLDHSNWGTNTDNMAHALDKARAMHRRMTGPGSPFGAEFAAQLPFIGVSLGDMVDDHDSGNNNVSSTYRWMPAALQSFREYHVAIEDNPAGLWQWVQRGRTGFIFLDVRSNRIPRGPGKSMLGPVQEVWVEQQLRRCATDPTLTWCVLVSPVPYNPRQSKLDSWSGFPDSRAWIEGVVKALRVKNILWVTGDCHWGSIVLAPYSPFTELNIPKSVLTGFGNTCNQDPDHWTRNSLRAGAGFGLLTLRALEAILAIYNADGSLRFSLAVPVQR
jgi:alkaline phosphatase D